MAALLLQTVKELHTKSLVCSPPTPTPPHANRV